MSRSHFQTTTATATTMPVIPVNHYESDFKIGFGVSLTGNGTRVFSVQHTFEDVLASANAVTNAVFFDHSAVSGQTASIDGNYAYPIAALRLNVASGSGAATVEFGVIQTGR